MAQTVDGVLGETVNYSYDMWNRLINATATDGAWGEQYTFEHFGNLTGKTPTAGSAPSMSVSYNSATNQQTGASYDANGNPLGGTPPVYANAWNVENRLSTTYALGDQITGYTYDPWGRRVWKQIPNSTGYTGEAYFYGAGDRSWRPTASRKDRSPMAAHLAHPWKASTSTSAASSCNRKASG